MSGYMGPVADRDENAVERNRRRNVRQYLARREPIQRRGKRLRGPLVVVGITDRHGQMRLGRASRAQVPRLIARGWHPVPKRRWRATARRQARST